MDIFLAVLSGVLLSFGVMLKAKNHHGFGNLLMMMAIVCAIISVWVGVNLMVPILMGK